MIFKHNLKAILDLTQTFLFLKFNVSLGIIYI